MLGSARARDEVKVKPPMIETTSSRTTCRLEVLSCGNKIGVGLHRFTCNPLWSTQATFPCLRNPPSVSAHNTTTLFGSQPRLHASFMKRPCGNRGSETRVEFASCHQSFCMSLSRVYNAIKSTPKTIDAMMMKGHQEPIYQSSTPMTSNLVPSSLSGSLPKVGQDAETPFSRLSSSQRP